MWIAFAFGSAFFAGLVAILAKAGMHSIPSTVATALRTVVVLLLAWAMVLVVGSEHTLASLDARTLVFLALSGLATGASWLCYFRALQLGPVSQVVAVDKTSIILTVVMAMVVFGETANLLVRLLGILGIGLGTFLMLHWRPGVRGTDSGNAWLPFAALSAIFAALTTVFAKVGITSVESNLGTALRTIVVLVMAWVMVFVTGEQRHLSRIARRDLLLLGLSGVATGASWLCYYKALQMGPVSGVVPIDKLSIAITVGLSALLFKERVPGRSLAGLALIIAGTLAMVF